MDSTEFAEVFDLARLWETARKRAEHALARVHWEPDPAIGADDIAQQTLLDLWREASHKGAGSVREPDKWVATVAWRRSLKTPRIGRHDYNEQAARILDARIEEFIHQHQRLPLESQRAELAAEVVSDMRSQTSRHPPQDEFDQLRRMVFIEFDRVDDTDLPAPPEADCSPGSPFRSEDVQALTQESFTIAADTPLDNLVMVTLMLNRIDEGYAFDDISTQHVADTFGRSSRWAAPHLEAAKDCIRSAAKTALIAQR